MSVAGSTRIDFDYRAAASAVFRLALGHGVEGRSAEEWRRALDVALEERCAALTWSRGGPSIRASAPDEVVVRWRAAWLRSAERVEDSVSALTPLVERLGTRGVAPIWIKGAPLSVRLYGDAAARESVDVDWFVEHHDRSIVADQLGCAGWSVAEGDRTADQTFALESGNDRVFLEVHSTLLHPRLSFLTLPHPCGTPIDLLGARVPALLDGPVLSLFLALHLAGHRAPPLLWWMDYLTLSSHVAEVEDVHALAARLGLARYLKWARRGCDAVQRLANGDLSAGRALGISRSGRVDVHPSVRHVLLAPNPTHAIAAARAWLLPPWVAREGRWPLATIVLRAARHAPTLLRTSQLHARAFALPRGDTSASHSVSRAAAAPRTDACATWMEKIRAIIEVGGEAWVEGSGFSMWPFIRAGDRVLIGAPRDIAVGSIVLLPLHGRAVLHRVKLVERDTVRTAGDANLISDAPVQRSQVMARALAADHQGTVVALVPTMRFGVAALARYARFTVRRYFAQIVRGMRHELTSSASRVKAQ